MRVLITPAAAPLARDVAAELGGRHQLRLFDTVPLEPTEGVEVVRGELTDAEAVWRAVRGVDAVIHTGESPELPASKRPEDQHALLDWATRGTHVLLNAGVDAGVKRFVYGSTLEIFAAYPEDVYISELYKPLPPPDMPVMARYLGELVCREFARDFPITATALRLGRLVLEEEVAGQPPNYMWLDRRDAARALVLALARDRSADMRFTARWAVFHIGADLPNPRYLIDTAVRSIGYAPQHNFSSLFGEAQ